MPRTKPILKAPKIQLNPSATPTPGGERRYMVVYRFPNERIPRRLALVETKSPGKVVDQLKARLKDLRPSRLLFIELTEAVFEDLKNGSPSGRLSEPIVIPTHTLPPSTDG